MAGELIEEYGDELESVTLTRGGSGQFEVTVDGQLIYSKQKEKRHTNPGEVIDNLRRHIG